MKASWWRGNDAVLQGGARRRHFWQVAATFGLLAVPVSAAVWQGAAANDTDGNGAQRVGNNTSGAIRLQAITDESSDSAPKTNHTNVSVDTRQSSSGSASNNQHVSIQSSHTNSSQSSASSSVTVNGKAVHVPKTGEVHKTISQGSGQTNVDISVDGSDTAAQTSSDSSTASINVQINSSTSTNQDQN